ncbi:MAG TPA: DUF2950 domain-containing protein [Phycisphaerales bacterium]|nr:DUF2950 domain-containing protein [Phycisphaerales bacterium]
MKTALARFRSLVRTVVPTLLAASLLSGCSSVKPAMYNSPEEATQSLVAALRESDRDKLRAVIGSEGEEILSSGDDVADKNALERFLASYDARHEFETPEDGVTTLVVGTDRWPMPVPIVRENGKWFFDTEAGKEEILNRRIGQNELEVIEVCKAIVDAQLEYAEYDPDHDGVHEYARRFISDEHLKNGLYWPVREGEPESPLGELAAEAAGEGYSTGDAPKPFHGYFYRILTTQGPNAAGGARDYIMKNYMIGGFGVVAYPAEYGSSGVMTFITNQDGVIYQKDLGANTSAAAKTMKAFDPGPGWSRVDGGH